MPWIVAVVLEHQPHLKRWHAYSHYNNKSVFGETREEALAKLKPLIREKLELYTSYGLEIEMVNL